jgi:biopolymer transport protein ExbB/biopolymer transport protein TolQ
MGPRAAPNPGALTRANWFFRSGVVITTTDHTGARSRIVVDPNARQGGAREAMQFTLSELWAHMGLFARMIVGVMAIMSIASLLVIVERAMAFNKSRNESRAFAAKLGGVLAKGDLDAAAGTKVGKEIGYLGRVITAGLSAYRTSKIAKPDVTFESVARALERQAQRETQTLKRGLAVLATVGSTAPFVGLLGTVMGILNSFQSMAASGSGGLGTVAGGIAEALITTGFGLMIAIPAVMAYNYLQGWVDARGVDISESSNEFLDVVARRLADVGGEGEAEAAE